MIESIRNLARKKRMNEFLKPPESTSKPKPKGKIKQNFRKNQKKSKNLCTSLRFNHYAAEFEKIKKNICICKKCNSKSKKHFFTWAFAVLIKLDCLWLKWQILMRKNCANFCNIWYNAWLIINFCFFRFGSCLEKYYLIVLKPN